MDTLEKLNALSNETDEDFFNHFQSHFSHEQIIEKLNELLANKFPDNLDNYFKGRFLCFSYPADFINYYESLDC